MATGTKTTYNLTTGLYLDIEPLIQLLDPFDTPLTGGYGADGMSTITQGTCFEKKVSWLDEVLLTPRSTAAVNVTSTGTTLTVATGDQAKFQTNDVILTPEGEYLYVTDYGTGDNLIVTRAALGSSASTIATSDVLVGVGSALPEGSDPPKARFVDRTQRDNVTQIFGPYAITISGSENVVRKYGIQDAGTTEFQHQVANRLKECMIGLESAVLYGKQTDVTASGYRTMGGMIDYITTNKDTTTTVLSESGILTQMQNCFDVGGSPDRLALGSKQKKALSAIVTTAGASATPFLNRTDNGRGAVVDFIDTDFGRVTAILDRWVRVADAFGFSRDQVELDTLTGRAIQFEQLAKTGDSLKAQIVGEKTLKFRRQRHAFRFTALT